MYLSQTMIPCGTLTLMLAFCAVANEHAGLDGAARPGERLFHILKDLPDAPASYQEPAARLVRAGVPDKHGHEEWAAIVMAHEFHQHPGIMTVVGAKMAIRAKELLDAPTRAIHVTVETGAKPPLACAIDGIQAAIASTLAQELITVPETAQPRPAATFRYKDRAVRLALREEYATQLKGYIAQAIQDFGNLTPAYFEEIEKHSYTVWADFDRTEVFVEEWRQRETGDACPRASEDFPGS